MKTSLNRTNLIILMILALALAIWIGTDIRGTPPREPVDSAEQAGKLDEIEFERLVEKFKQPIRRALGVKTPLATAEGAQEFIVGVKAMEDLLQEWNPEGATAEQVEKLLGVPTSRGDRELRYRFDSGLGGSEWAFVIEDNRISDVHRRPLN